MISFEARSAYIQHRIFLSFNLRNFKLLKNLQKLYAKSLVLKFRMVRNVVNFYSLSFFKTNQFFFNDKEKLLLALNLNYNISCANFDNYFLVAKKKSLSFFFDFPDLYNSCVNSLCSEVVLPVVESLSDRIVIGFRPYRSYQEFYLHCKMSIFKFRKPFWFFISELNTNSTVTEWLIKNFPFDKLFLKQYFKSFKFDNRSFSSIGNKVDNLFFILFNFLLNGLVCYKKSIFYLI